MAPALLFKNPSAFDSTETLRDDAQVPVKDGRISAVTDKSSNNPFDCDVIGFADRTLMSGLIDAHVHVQPVDLDLAEATNRRDAYMAAANKTLRKMLHCGFTTVREGEGTDVGFSLT